MEATGRAAVVALLLLFAWGCTGGDGDVDPVDTVAVDPGVTAIDPSGDASESGEGPDAVRVLDATLCERLLDDEDFLDALGAVPQAPPTATVEQDDALAFVTCGWTVTDPIHTIVLQVEVARDDVTRSLFASSRDDPLGTPVEGLGLAAAVSETGSWNVDVAEDVRFGYFPVAATEAPDADRALVTIVATRLAEELER